jgi:hypothetical protein
LFFVDLPGLAVGERLFGGELLGGMETVVYSTEERSDEGSPLEHSTERTK